MSRRIRQVRAALTSCDTRATADGILAALLFAAAFIGMLYV
jgi:hypothetical protein